MNFFLKILFTKELWSFKSTMMEIIIGMGIYIKYLTFNCVAWLLLVKNIFG
jgi:hypothetical protein